MYKSVYYLSMSKERLSQSRMQRDYLLCLTGPNGRSPDRQNFISVLGSITVPVFCEKLQKKTASKVLSVTSLRY